MPRASGITHLVRLLWHEMPRRSLTVLTLTVAVALLQGASLLLVLPLLSLVGVPVGTSTGLGWAGAALDGLHWTPTLGGVLVVFVALNALSILLTFLHAQQSAAIQQHAVARVRQRLLDALDAVEWAHFTRLDRSAVAHALTMEAERVGVAANQFVTGTAQALVILAYAAVALRVSPLLTLSVLTVAGLLLVLQRPLTTRLHASGTRLGHAMQGLYSSTLQWLQGMKAMRFEGRAPLGTDTVRDLQIQAQRQRATGRALFESGAVLVLAVAVLAAVSWLRLAPATLLFLLFAYARILPRAAQLQTHIQALAHALPAQDALARLTDGLEAAAEPETGHVLPPDLPAPPGPAAPTSAPTPAPSHGLVLDNATYRHPDGATIGPIHLHLPAGTLTVLRGPSGAGKTTTLDLAAGLLAPTTGTLTLDGKPLLDRRAWRRNVAYLPQEPFLLDGTVLDNLTWVAPHADEATLHDALHRAGIHLRLDQRVGERGHNLSGGERQRLALAMALLRRPRLLILDEPTSDLDPEATARILRTLEGLAGTTTVLMATHGPTPQGATVVEVQPTPPRARI